MTDIPGMLVASEKLPLHSVGATLPKDLVRGGAFWGCLNGLLELCVAGLGIQAVIRVGEMVIHSLWKVYAVAIPVRTGVLTTMKYLFKQQKDRIGGCPLEIRQSVRKADLPRNQFYWLGFFADLVLKQFDHRASVEFRETDGFYYITVTREEDSR